MSSEKPLVYLILGSAGAGRRAIVADLIEGGLSETDRAAVMLSDAEAPNGFDASLPLVTRWNWADKTVSGTVPGGVTHVFFVTDGRANPVDQVEAFKPWLEAQGAELARVLCVVDCQLAEKNPPLVAWYEACVHFADVVLLARREGVGNKWISDFQTHFKKQFMPALFEMLKQDHVKNPVLVLEPQARRISQVFDEEQDWVLTNAEGEEVDEDDETKEDEEIEAKVVEDPYFARHSGGRRVREIPDIVRYLGPAAP